MSSYARRGLALTSTNNENPTKNIKNTLITSRKKNALKVLTNTVQSTKKSGSNGLKQLKVLPMINFETGDKCKSVLKDNSYNEEVNHFECTTFEKDSLPDNMTCNIDMLSDFFSTKNDVENDWFLEDYNNIMINEINNTFDNFGNDQEYYFPTLPIMDFPEFIFA
ncbi:uncharacterized protein LOC112687888 [Sipha flava]|uniref:Uncharacterized protein LOC112687888 n=1 Tax=Sipha flava TaxID=143950 RepID=A0A8B8G0V1_9HEMI|nr:uncharacterized protein LOC112687888 [Sipha flava]XP_025416648.1 uncharacterized protein LOC112687888 [Sipha flava]